MLPMVRHRSSLEKIVKLAIPPDNAFFCALNKSETTKLARRLGIPVPRGILVSCPEDVSRLDVDFDFPVVVKPVASVIATDAGMVAFRVSYAHSKRQLIDKLAELLPSTPVLLEQYFVGTGMGLEVLADGGRILCVLQHVRVHEPIHGGGSSYRKTVALDPKLLTCTEKLISVLGWTGVAMVEFKYNEDTQDFVLVEVNGRFWGSLPLAIAAGADFPYYLYQLLVEGEKTFPATYKKGIYCRNLRLDGQWFVQNLFTRPSKYNNALPLWELLFEPFNILLLREHYDTFSWDDLYPGLKEIAAILGIVREKLEHNFTRHLLKLLRTKESQLKGLKYVCAKSPVSVCFVCKGNIGRSPFAESYLKKILVARGCPVKVESAGYYRKELRPCPAQAICAAQKFDIDLSKHRSKIVSSEVISRNDVVFVFDIENWNCVRKRFRLYKSKIYFLGSLARNSHIQLISDPYGKGTPRFEAVYSSMVPLLEAFASMLTPNPSCSMGYKR
jgi:protein-tyrosine-phosphatase